jgi:CPA2 family monovalent cation:H+ antiporter-2
VVEPAFLLELGGIVVGLAVLARVAGRWQLPVAPLFLLAGLAFGRGGVVICRCTFVLMPPGALTSAEDCNLVE